MLCFFAPREKSKYCQQRQYVDTKKISARHGNQSKLFKLSGLPMLVWSGIEFAICRSMFRITKTFENEATEIFQIEGQVSDETAGEWSREIELLKKDNARTVILDFAHVWFISNKGVEALRGILSDSCYVMNCGMEVRNVLYMSGMSSRMLG